MTASCEQILREVAARGARGAEGEFPSTCLQFHGFPVTPASARSLEYFYGPHKGHLAQPRARRRTTRHVRTKGANVSFPVYCTAGCEISQPTECLPPRFYDI